MRTTFVACASFVLVLALAARAQTPAVKIGVLHVQNAILSTVEGHQVFAAFEAKFAAKKAELEKRQVEIAALQEQLRKGSVTMSADVQRKLSREIDRKTNALNHDADDVQSEYREEQEDLTQTLDRKFRLVLDKWAKDAGLSVVLDVGNPQTPAYWWANAVDITAEVVRAYDSQHPPPVSKEQR